MLVIKDSVRLRHCIYPFEGLGYLNTCFQFDSTEFINHLVS